MIITLMIVVFVLGYMAIALEHPIKVDKAASALIIGGLGWALFAIGIFDVIDFEIVANKFASFKEWYSVKFPGKEINEYSFLKYELSHHLLFALIFSTVSSLQLKDYLHIQLQHHLY